MKSYLTNNKEILSDIFDWIFNPAHNPELSPSLT
jgi:hypothetical protein